MTSILIHRPRTAAYDTLSDTLAAADHIEQVLVAPSAEELLSQYARLRPDVVLLGLEIDDLLDLVRQLRTIDPSSSILVVGSRDKGLQTARAIASGARGFLGRDLVAGTGRGPGPQPRSSQSNRPSLTAREQQVLVGMSDGRSNAEIGQEFFLSEDTIKTHARRMFRKLGAKDRAEAVALGFRSGLLF